MADNKQVR